MKLDLEPLDLSRILAESLRVVSGRAEDKHLTLDADIESAWGVVRQARESGRLNPRRAARTVRTSEGFEDILPSCNVTSNKLVSALVQALEIVQIPRIRQSVEVCNMALGKFREQ